MMSDGGLVGATNEETQASDDFISALSTVAYAGAPELDIVDDVRRSRSRFFFKVTPSLSQHVKQRAVKLKPKKLQHVDQVITDRAKTYKREIPDQLSTNMERVREFFLKVLGPKTLAGAPGSQQARQVVQRLLNTEVDGQAFVKFDRMSETAVSLVMARFVADYYNLPKSAVQTLLDSITPRAPMVVPMPYPEKTNVNRNTQEGKKSNTSQ
jgi:hypothetical protein